MLAHTYNITIDHGVRAPGYVREVVYIFHSTEKKLISMLTTTVRLPGAEYYD